MAGRGRAPKAAADRERRNVPERGDWQPTPGSGWQHGPIPPPPTKLLGSSRATWETWFRAWYAAHWRPEDVPAIRHVIRLYDAVERGQLQRATELRLAEDTWGITPKGQQDRRWSTPKEESPAKAGPDAGGPSDPTGDEAPAEISRYRHLRSTG
jgi:hypothetical protein